MRNSHCGGARRSSLAVLSSLLVGVILVSARPAQAQSELVPASGCSLYESPLKAGEHLSWDGQCRNGLAEGAGTVRRTGAAGQVIHTYTGEMARGKKNGFGRSWWSPGREYEGDYKDNAKDGYGELRIPKGEPDIKVMEKLGDWEGDVLVIRGEWDQNRMKNSSGR